MARRPSGRPRCVPRPGPFAAAGPGRWPRRRPTLPRRLALLAAAAAAVLAAAGRGVAFTPQPGIKCSGIVKYRPGVTGSNLQSNACVFDTCTSTAKCPDGTAYADITNRERLGMCGQFCDYGAQGVAAPHLEPALIAIVAPAPLALRHAMPSDAMASVEHMLMCSTQTPGLGAAHRV